MMAGINWKKPILFDGISRHYGELRALDDISLQLNAGAIYGVLGANGSGKTTMLRLLNLLERPTNGRISLAGVDPWQVAEKSRLELGRSMTMVFQQPVLFSGSVRDNIGYGLKMRGLAASEIRAKVGWVAKLLAVEHLLDRRSMGLSAGEKQKVALARALAIEPRLLILDEATANLDPNHVIAIESAITAFNKERKTTVVMVTHNLAQAQRVTDRILFFSRGALVVQEETQKFFSSSEHLEIVEWLGMM